MKLIILQEKLKEGIGIIERISIKSLSLPILNNLLLEAKENFISLTTTNLELAIKWWALAKIEKEGIITIPTRIFSSFINSLPNKPIILESKNLELSVECENYQTTLKGLNYEDFPIIPQINKEESILINSRSFCQGLTQVVDIATSTTTKPEISGIYLVFQKGLIKMVATDSFRLGEKTLSLKNPSSLLKEYALILPQKTTKEIINIFSEKEGDLSISFSPNQILFESQMPETPHPQIQVTSRLIEGEYPNYEEILPKKHETQIIVSKNEFLNQIKSASLFSGKINEVKLKINPKTEKIEVFSQSSELGEYYSYLSGRIEGKELEISFNHRFLIDGLLNIKNSEVILGLTGVEGPGVLKPSGDESYIYVIMPIKAN